MVRSSKLLAIQSIVAVGTFAIEAADFQAVDVRVGRWRYYGKPDERDRERSTSLSVASISLARSTPFAAPAVRCL